MEGEERQTSRDSLRNSVIDRRTWFKDKLTTGSLEDRKSYEQQYLNLDAYLGIVVLCCVFQVITEEGGTGMISLGYLS